MSLAARAPDPETRAGEDVSAAALDLAREVVDLAGAFEALDADARAQRDRLAELEAEAAGIGEANAEVSAAADRIDSAARAAQQAAAASRGALGPATDRMRASADWLRGLEDRIGALERSLAEVSQSNAAISGIAMQVSILAVNASIEAARAGAAGRGFAVVAEAVNDLSQRTGAAADDIGRKLRGLTGWAADLRAAAERAAKDADAVGADVARVEAALGSVDAAGGAIAGATAEIAAAAQAIARGGDAFARALERMAGSVDATAEGVAGALGRMTGLVELSEAMVQAASAMGEKSADAGFIAHAGAVASRISEAFEAGISRGEITESALFDHRYDPIPGTNPQQVTAPFTTFCERVLPEIQESALRFDPRVVFCAAVDVNGYLPVHNRAFSRPQGDDPVWNAAHSRNRRIFGDRVGLKAGRNRRAFLLQVYRRDLGGGRYAIMKDLSVPITVRGRHWGGLRLAYTF